MLLTIDVGNSQTAVGCYSDSRLLHLWFLNTSNNETSDELRAKVSALLQAEGIAPTAIKRAAVASVVPRLFDSWRRAIFDAAGVNAAECRLEAASGLFENSHVDPRQIGPDRIANIIAAVSIYGPPVVVVDFGTATSFDVIDESGSYRGGIIAPGLQVSAQALFSCASRLSTVELFAPDDPVGRTTEEAVRSGIVLGEAARVDGLIDRIFLQLGYETAVVLTGADAPLVEKCMISATYVNPKLTMEGLRIIAEGGAR